VLSGFGGRPGAVECAQRHREARIELVQVPAAELVDGDRRQLALLHVHPITIIDIAS